MWEPNSDYRGPYGITYGESLCSLAELANVLDTARHDVKTEKSPRTSIEEVFLTDTGARRAGNFEGHVIVAEWTVRSLGRDLAQRFAREALVYIECFFRDEKDETCTVKAFDVDALRRARCRRTLLPLLHWRVSSSVFPRDLRVLLAQLVWKTRCGEEWADTQEDADMTRIMRAMYDYGIQRGLITALPGPALE